MAASHTWVLGDASTATLAELTTATGKTLNFKRNYYGEASCTISHEDDAAALLLNALRNTGIPTLRCYRRADGASSGTLVFHGYLAPFQEDLEEQATLSLTFRGPFGRFLGDGSARGRYTDNFIEATGQDAGNIATGLIDLYGGTGTVGASSTIFTNADGPVVIAEDDFCGLGIGTIEPTKVRDRQYQSANVGESIVNLTEVLDGFDFQERYVHDGRTLALFDVMARQGQDRPAAKFEYGETTLRNVRHVSRTTEPPINVVRLMGAYGLSSVQKDQASVDKYTKWYYQETRSDIYEQATLDDKAKALLRPNPVETISFSPDPALAPSPWDQYWLADTVHFYGRRGAFVKDVAARTNTITVVVDDNGFEAAEIPDPMAPEDEAVLRAGLSVEVVA